MASNDSVAGFDHSDLLKLVLSSQRARLDFDNDHRLCTTDKESHVVDLFEVFNEPATAPRSLTFTDATTLSSYLSKLQRRTPSEQSSINFFFVHQENTWAPLNASKTMISSLAEHIGSSTGIFHSLASFRDRIVPIEEAFSGAVRSIYSDHKFELGYVYKYPEQRVQPGISPWKIRQSALHHVRNRDGSPSTFIIISPYPRARFAEYLKSSLHDARIRAMILAYPMVVHTMLISTHFNSWRGYLEYQEKELIEADMSASCTALSQPLVNFETLKQVRGIERALLPLEPLLKSFKELVSSLDTSTSHFRMINAHERHGSQALKTSFCEMQGECESYRQHAAYLSRWAQSTAQSISDTLSLHQSENACILAKSARDDSVAIKILTLVASCYLPFSFVATMLGMNLVAFDDKTTNLVVSNQFWLYPALAFPLMAVTVALCRVQMWKHNKDEAPCALAFSKDEFELKDLENQMSSRI